jgi:MoaA/NifB/PqqE/SkfB family radical SAM enzyme
MQNEVKFITGWKARLIRAKVHWFIISEAFNFFGNPITAYSEMKRLRNLRNSAHGSTVVTKYIKSGSHYFWNSDYCGYPSDNLRSLIHSEFIRNRQSNGRETDEFPILQTLIWGITNRCQLSCQHCYEWDNISQSDFLDLNTLEKILDIFKTSGVRHIQLSGGEPLVRFNDLVSLIEKASPTIECWLLTSGFGLTPEKAFALKQSGLIGVNISLDHWDAAQHNQFRNNDKSFAMVAEAAKNCRNAGIMVSLSLCATREFVNEENLEKYAVLAKDMGANFIRILEPRAVGKFKGKLVGLDGKQVRMLSDFTIRINSKPQYNDFPIVVFFGYHQRKLGCFGAGNRYLYVDPNGDVHACPFCRGKIDNILEIPFTKIIQKTREFGCHQFDTLSQ